MAHLVSMLKSKQMKERSLGIFGSYGWSGGAVKALREFAESPGWELVEPVVESQCAPKEEALKLCRDLGKNLGERVLAA
jgi:flavorubredoxin